MTIAHDRVVSARVAVNVTVNMCGQVKRGRLSVHSDSRSCQWRSRSRLGMHHQYCKEMAGASVATALRQTPEAARAHWRASIVARDQVTSATDDALSHDGQPRKGVHLQRTEVDPTVKTVNQPAIR
jgi:hypothetical protein